MLTMNKYLWKDMVILHLFRKTFNGPLKCPLGPGPLGEEVELQF